MLMTEWNWDDAKQVWQDEAREEGIIQGRDEEWQYFLNLLNQGLSLEEIKEQISTTKA